MHKYITNNFIKCIQFSVKVHLLPCVNESSREVVETYI